MSPCTVLVARELAATLPATCFEGISSGIRSSKLVSMRLNAVVCELAILPDTFSSAYDCARIPVTAVVRAPNRPMTSSPTRNPRGLTDGTAATSGRPSQAACQLQSSGFSIGYERWRSAAPAQFCLVRQDLPGFCVAPG